MLTVASEFTRHVSAKRLEADCWLWEGDLNSGGYGLLHRSVKPRLAHRAVYEMLVGPIPEGLQLDHLCSNKRCVNPSHLEPVTRTVNVRRAFAIRQSAVQCPKGHPYSGDNLYVNPRGYKVCRKCQKVHKLKFNETHRV